MSWTEASESYRSPLLRGTKGLVTELGVFKRLPAHWTYVRTRSSEAILL
jgi:hypothetical protein